MSKNQATGRQWERYVEAEIESCNAIGLGYYARCPEPLRVLRSIGDARVEATYAKKAQPDYYGILPGGQGVIWDAKLVTDSDRFDFSRLAVHQHEAMKATARAGGLAFVYVGRWPEQEKYLLPVDADGGICGVRDKRHIKFERLGDYRKAKGEYFPQTLRRILDVVAN